MSSGSHADLLLFFTLTGFNPVWPANYILMSWGGRVYIGFCGLAHSLTGVGFSWMGLIILTYDKIFRISGKKKIGPTFDIFPQINSVISFQSHLFP